MALIFDTSVLIELEKQNEAVIDEIRKLSLTYPGRPFITSPTVSEFFCGGFGKNISDHVEILHALQKYNLLQTTLSSSVLLGTISHVLSKQGKKIPIFDLFIVSLAIDNDMPLVTLDKHFKNIPGLDVIVLNPQ